MKSRDPGLGQSPCWLARLDELYWLVSGVAGGGGVTRLYRSAIGDMDWPSMTSLHHAREQP
jgi:hypothetical protein